MNILTRKVINPKTVFVKKNFDGLSDERVDYNEFCSMIDRWKTFFIEKYDAQVGETVFLHCNINIPYYYAAVFAVAELGLSLITDWSACLTAADVDGTRSRMYGIIDYVVVETYNDSAPDDGFYYYTLRNVKYSKNLIKLDSFKDYQVSNHDLFASMKDLIRCNPNDVLVITASSGTTGSPTLVKETHDKIIKMSKYTLANQNFSPEDKVIHTATLHHGSSMCLHFLPSLFACWQQYICAPGSLEQHKKFVDFCHSEKINRLFLYTSQLIRQFLATIPKIDHELKILTLHYIYPEFIEMIRQKNIASISSTFGDSTIGSMFFLKTITQDTELSTYSMSNMGKPLGDFYKFEIRNSLLYIKSDEINLDWSTSKDVFTVENGDYIFHGRAHEFRVGDEWVSLGEINAKVSELFGDNAMIVPDFELQKLYFAIWNRPYNYNFLIEELTNFFKNKFHNIKIDSVNFIKYRDFFNGRKVDPSKVRDHIRSL